ncbi:ATP-binding protein [Streptomyces sp. NBC_00102]|uniref:ATP-binding protein n=1 Tax=Streptomyces sp. NBC_00102 TaxID=2975652 RepID=UPI0022519B17|nr:ATP-binding protein [Streptomyces sp. NBC_00102]MCX5395576.1 ATP-binding protein [Streptomyces sp. NBC_00102]
MSEALPPRDTLKLADTPNAVGLARLHTTNVLSRWGVPAEIVETVKLIVSELTTNAVRHPKEAGDEVSIYSSEFDVQTFELALEIDRDAVRVSVWDHDARPPVLTEPGVEATSGRGILIVAAVSNRWGHHLARGLPGKVVWAEVSLSSARESREQSMGSPPATERGRLRADPKLLGRVLVGVREL